MTARHRSLPLVLCALALVPAAPAAAQAPPDQTDLTVTGRGVVEARPDRAEVRYVLRRIAGTREAARSSVARRARSLIGRLRSLGVEQSAIRLSSVVVERRSQRRGLRRPFIASGVVAARTPDVGLAGRMLDLAPPLGADVRGPDFELADEGPALETATRSATVDARRRAEAVAQGLGLRIVAIRSVRLGDAEGGGFSQPAQAQGEVGQRTGPTTPAAPGTITVRASVTVVFVLAR